jgi:hypothetical protein
MLHSKNKRMVWIARILIGIVTFFNLQAAIQFMLQPEFYAAGFEIGGSPGEAMIRGVGLLFLMWNIPYIVALIHPFRHFVSLCEAVVMQAIGLAGESVILLTLAGEHPQITSSVTRFIIFDGSGLLLLLIASGCILWVRKQSK